MYHFSFLPNFPEQLCCIHVRTTAKRQTLIKLNVNKSNIFVHIELSKLVASLTTNILLSKEFLKSQAGYFNIIPPKYFSDALSPEWQNITDAIKQKGPKVDADGRIVVNAVLNTIEQMSSEECIEIAMRIIDLRDKVKLEFE